MGIYNNRVKKISGIIQMFRRKPEHSEIWIQYVFAHLPFYNSLFVKKN